MQYDYVITTYYDGELKNTHRLTDLFDADEVQGL